MTLMIQSWCPGQGCDPCAPLPIEPPPPGGDLPFFTDAYVHIKQYQVATDLHGNEVNYLLGAMTIWIATDNLPPQGGFGVPLTFGPPAESSVVSSFIAYLSVIQILNPYHDPSTYDGNLPDITTGLQGSDVGANQAASVTAGNAAIAQANQVLGNP